MAIADVRTFWNAFITVLLKCAAALGFAVPSSARAPFPARDSFPAAPRPVAPRPEAACDGAMTFPFPLPRPSEPVRDRSLPPTMKQRILAEAHGASPRARNLPGGIADPGPAVNTAPEAPIPSAVSVRPRRIGA